MNPHRRTMAWINVIGGIAVLGSYAHGILTHEAPSAVWGGVPDALRPLYTASMFSAAAGYLIFTAYLFFAARPESSRVGKRFDLGLFNLLYFLILLPSALWMPLTFEMLEAPSRGLWLAVRVDLAIVGLASAALVGALVALRPREPALFYWLAVAGSLAFTFQTGVLDAVVWPAYFPVSGS